MSRLHIDPGSSPEALRRRRVENYLAHRHCRAQGDHEAAEACRAAVRQIGRAMKGKRS